MAKDRAILHQPVTQKHLLAGHDVRPCKQSRSVCGFDDLRYWRLVVIGVIGEQTHDEKAEHQDNGRRPNPTSWDHQWPLFTVHTSLLACIRGLAPEMRAETSNA